MKDFDYQAKAIFKELLKDFKSLPFQLGKLVSFNTLKEQGREKVKALVIADLKNVLQTDKLDKHLSKEVEDLFNLSKTDKVFSILNNRYILNVLNVLTDLDTLIHRKVFKRKQAKYTHTVRLFKHKINTYNRFIYTLTPANLELLEKLIERAYRQLKYIAIYNGKLSIENRAGAYIARFEALYEMAEYLVINSIKNNPEKLVNDLFGDYIEQAKRLDKNDSKFKGIKSKLLGNSSTDIFINVITDILNQHSIKITGKKLKDSIDNSFSKGIGINTALEIVKNIDKDFESVEGFYFTEEAKIAIVNLINNVVELSKTMILTADTVEEVLLEEVKTLHSRVLSYSEYNTKGFKLLHREALRELEEKIKDVDLIFANTENVKLKYQYNELVKKIRNS